MSQEMLPMLLASCAIVFVFIVIAFLVIRKRNLKDGSSNLKASLRKTGARNTKLGRTAFYQKVLFVLL